MEFEKFHYQNETALLRQIEEAKLDIPYSKNINCLKCEAALLKKRLKNRLVAQPIEGFDAEPDGAPGERTLERYRRLAAGGSGLLWLESVSVCREGRTNPHQLWIREENLEQFRKLRECIRTASPDCYTVLQLTHSGRNSGPNGTASPICAMHNPYIHGTNERMITDAELDALQEAYVRAAELAEKAGFDAVDIRTCHGYLINELLAARDRKGKYGGSLENRCRFLLEVIEKLKGRTIESAVRLNICDGLPYPYGFGINEHGEEDYQEAEFLLGKLAQAGVRLLNITNGIGAYSPYMIRPYDVGSVPPPEHPLEGIARMIRCAELAKKAAPGSLIVGSGLSWLREFAPYVCAGCIETGKFDLAGFGRLSLYDPAYAEKILTGSLSRKDCCITCSGCTKLIKSEGKKLRCVLKKEGGLHA